MSDIGEGPVGFRRVDIQAFVKRLVRYYETQGNGDWRYAAEIIEQQHDEIERLRARIAELEAASQRLLGALADIASSDDMTHAQRRKKAARVYDELQPIIDRGLK